MFYLLKRGILTVIQVIGIGPTRGDMTLRAIKALEDADVVIGYGGYLDKISDLIEGKEIIGRGMGQEVERAEIAVKKSQQGHRVVLVSSGDPGVYGMANVLYQLIGKYSGVEVEIIPGVTAATYAASLLGAPLHDFAVVSLSDILTPISEIKRKIKAAIEADLIIVLYNPRSKTRKKPFEKAYDILMKKGRGSLPVGIVRGGKNPLLKVTTLKELNPEDIDMNTTIIVGNKFTYVDRGSMITSRGYVISKQIHPLAEEFYSKYLAGEGQKGPNLACEYYPCHSHPQNCTFCYCPFYPCGDGSTGGRWIKKEVWSCVDCQWIHQDKTVECIEGKLPKLLKKVEDLQNKKKELLKLRRECIYYTK